MTGLGFVRLDLAEVYTRRYAEMVQESLVEITRGLHTVEETQIYAGRARVHALSGAVQMGFGDEPQYMVSGQISVPVIDPSTGEPTDPRVNDMVLVVVCRDAHAQGRSFRVMHVDIGGQFNDVCTMTVLGAEDSPTIVAPPEPDPGPGPWDPVP